jgi:hypothetical protein
MSNSIIETVIRPYPPITLTFSSRETINPAIQLFGSRLFADQTVLEFLVELMLVANSPKKLLDMKPFNSVFPDRNVLQNWSQNKKLLYDPPARLNLKLFSFLGVSKLETRHESHKKYYKYILKKIESHIDSDSSGEKEDILRTIENLFLGFQGVGQNRTWCAQTFIPVSVNVLARETIWEQTKAKDNSVKEWSEALKHFSHSQHLFLARGGELLYLQLCNALRQSSEEIDSFSRLMEISLNETEADPLKLYNALGIVFKAIMTDCPPALDKIALLIDQIDEETVKRTDGEGDDEPFANCGWCHEDSWMEGYLFAVEFLRVCQAEIDPIERIEMLKLCCAFQVLRSLCAQSARVVHWSKERLSNGNGLGFIWAISSPLGEDSIIKQVSQRNLRAIQQLIYNAIRIPEIKKNVENNYQRISEKTTVKTIYNEADTRYGDRFFLSLSKKIGFVVPKKGPGARFVLSDQIIRYFVLSLIRPGERCTLDTFKHLMFAHYGLAIDGKYIQKACIWSDYPQLSESAVSNDDWLVQKLRASGFLIHLSDACSLVQNPFGEGGK